MSFLAYDAFRPLTPYHENDLIESLKRQFLKAKKRFGRLCKTAPRRNHINSICKYVGVFFIHDAKVTHSVSSTQSVTVIFSIVLKHLNEKTEANNIVMGQYKFP